MSRIEVTAAVAGDGWDCTVTVRNGSETHAQQAASATDPSSGRVVTGPDQARRALEVRVNRCR
jgi:hypothetical protein